ncbi:MAG: dihydroorotate dehydrogenase electron transfer subunit [Sedimentisphaerales bacterium]|nr:dihydroorotate dehydrogenase electron transfer subunit [Sedimentisphaerales bacterium]
MNIEQEAIKTKTDKGLFDSPRFAVEAGAFVCSHKQIRGRFFRLGLEFTGAGAKAFSKARPGQFTQLDLSKVALPPAEKIPQDLLDATQRKILLRRPFSFSDVTANGDKTIVEILYCVVGPATLRMSTLANGNSVSVIGPLGNGFSIPADKKTALLIVGGMGAGPLIHLAKVLTTDCPTTEVFAFAGAKTKEKLPFGKLLDKLAQEVGFSLAEFARYGVQSFVATDDGSAGFAGTVTNCFSDWLKRCGVTARDTIIYACGPEAMLAGVAEIARDRKIDCQVSMERMMACGIGLCQSCPVECKTNGSGETIYKLCCKDGPVFDSKEVVFGS